jgi:enoyl-CoA hydratase
MSYEFIIYDTDGPVARILHNRPAKRNAQSMELLDEVDHALDRAQADPDIRVIIIGAVGDHFSAGHDVVVAGKDRPKLNVEQRHAHESRLYYNQSLKVWDCPKPTIAMVQGACIAGGFMLANVCDLVVASEDAFFSDPVCHSLGAAAVELLLHPWVAGSRQAKDMLFTGRRVYAPEAHTWGMVNRIVPRDQLEAETMALAQHIAKAPEFTLKIVKKSTNRAMDIQGFRASLEAHFDTHQLSHYSEAFKERTSGDRADQIKVAREIKA